MGVKYFFSFIKDRFPESITPINSPMENIDNLMIDLNGIFHTCAQSVYSTSEVQYYLTYQPRLPTLKQQFDTFEKIWKMITNIFSLAPPRKRLILCIDGVAPFAKQTQQRQRRFKAVKDKIKGEWDSNCITPGTVFMDHLSKFIDFKIRVQLSEGRWRGLEIIFSNEKCPQEGEHKIIKWVRQNHSQESYCLHGMDADLVMLGLSTEKEKFHILRQNHLNPNQHYDIDLDKLRIGLTKMFMFNSPQLDEKRIIRDFVFMLFTVGNDFLPHLPAIEILERGIDILAEVYRINSEKYSYLTEIVDEKAIFRKESFSKFLELLGQYEQDILNKKANHFVGYIDPILEECKQCKNTPSDQTPDIYTVDFERYKTLYYKNKLGGRSVREICFQYIEGLQWVLNYYTTGITSWKWYYPHYYTVFSSDLSKFVLEYQTIQYTPSTPLTPFEQLLCVLPPFSSSILPSPLNTLLEEKSPLKKYYPEGFDIDLEGKRNDWEGIAILPFIDLKLIQTHYQKLICRVPARCQKRNIVGKTFIYRWVDDNELTIYKSWYGNLNTKVELTLLDL